MGSRDTQEETLRLKAKRAWEDAQALAAKDAEIERLKAENQRYERLFTTREQDHKELCERYDQLEAQLSASEEKRKVLGAAMRLIAAQDQGAGGNVTEAEAWRSAKAIATNALEAP